MLQTVRLAMKINLRPDRLPVIVMVEQELPQFLHGLAFGQGGGSVDFHPVACGKNDGFRDNARPAQLLQGGGNGRLREGEALPYRDGRGMMA